MSLQRYRHVLAIPGVRGSLLLTFFGRLPMTVMAVTLTLHIVNDLGRGYGAGGLAAGMVTAGGCIGGPLVGRMIDKHGLRPVIALCGAMSVAYWVSAPYLPYWSLTILAFPAGMLILPIGSINRQVLTALVPNEQRRTAYSLDSIVAEISFMIGPAVGIVIATSFSSSITLTGIGLCSAPIAAVLWWRNPPVRAKNERRKPGEVRPPLRSWLTKPFIGVLLLPAGALFCIIGSEVSALATMRADGQVVWTGLVLATMCLASLTGGLLHGSVHHSLSQRKIMVLVCCLTIPVAFVHGQWWLLALALIPSNLGSAPTVAASSEKISAMAPPQARGEAMGLFDSSLRLGLAVGSPVVGFVIDHSAPSWGFAAAGGGGLIFAAAAWALQRSALPKKTLTESNSTLQPALIKSDVDG